MVSTASTNALPMNCPWRNKLSPSPRPRRGVHIVKVCPVDNIYLLCYTATCLSSIAGAGYSSPFPSHQGVHTRWFGRAQQQRPCFCLHLQSGNHQSVERGSVQRSDFGRRLVKNRPPSVCFCCIHVSEPVDTRISLFSKSGMKKPRLQNTIPKT